MVRVRGRIRLRVRLRLRDSLELVQPVGVLAPLLLLLRRAVRHEQLASRQPAERT